MTHLPSSPEEKLELSNDLANVENRLMQLDYERRDEGHIAGPVAMLSVGYGMSLVSMAVALGSYFSAEAAKDWDIGDEYKGRLDVNDDGIIDNYDENAYRRIARSFAIVSGVGAAVGIAGSILLAHRLKERRAHEPERRSLERRRRELRRELDYATNVGPTGVQLSLSGRF